MFILFMRQWNQRSGKHLLSAQWFLQKISLTLGVPDGLMGLRRWPAAFTIRGSRSSASPTSAPEHHTKRFRKGRICTAHFEGAAGLCRPYAVLRIRIKLKGRIRIRIRIKVIRWIRIRIKVISWIWICRWQAKMHGIWAYLSTFSRFWAFTWKLESGSGSASKRKVGFGTGSASK